MFVPRVSEVGTVLMLPAVIKRKKRKKGSYAVVRSRAAHLVPGNKPPPPSCQWDADSSVQPERLQPPAAAVHGPARLTWEPTSPASHPSPPDSSAWPLSHSPVIYVVRNSPPSEIKMTSRFATSSIKPRALLPYLLTSSSSDLSLSSFLSEGAMKATWKYGRSFLLVLSITIFTC